MDNRSRIADPANWVLAVAIGSAALVALANLGPVQVAIAIAAFGVAARYTIELWRTSRSRKERALPAWLCAGEALGSVVFGLIMLRLAGVEISPMLCGALVLGYTGFAASALLARRRAEHA